MQTRLYLTPADHGRPLNWDEFATAQGQEGYRYELIDGRVEVSPLPDMPHDELCDWLKRILNQYALLHPEVLSRVKGPARVFLPEPVEGITAPEPDIACYSDIPNDLPISAFNWRNFSPLLVVEVLSEDTEDKDLGRNRRLYGQVPSIREYWVVDTRASFDRPSLIVFRRRGERWAPRLTVPSGGTYTTRMLPGLELRLDPQG